MKLQTARGVRDIPPEEKIVKNKVVTSLQSMFERYGFLPLETPIIERFETLAAKGGAGTASDALKETFTFQDQGKRKLGLRFELTTSLARYVTQNPTLKLPFKRYEMGPVFRDGPIKLGRYRQFWQCDVDTIGTASMLADAEIVSLAQTFFNFWNLNVVIKVNNRKLLNGILTQAGIKNKENALIAIDKLEKIGIPGVKKELQERKYTAVQIKKVLSCIQENITLPQLQKIMTDEEGKEGIEELKELFSYCKLLGVKNAMFDMSMVRGLSYYTGTVFEVFLKKGKVTSSLAGGGRYDNMIGNFMGGNRIVPAVGIAFGIAPIMDVLKEKETKTESIAKVYIIPINTVKESLKIAQTLRDKGINTDFALGKKGVSKNLQYANALRIPYTIIIGEDEVKKGKVTLRNMVSGNETLLTLSEVITQLQ
ncbi:histidine--tRNA ligase [Candidatus Woesearchaeota archaeon]|nr:histidine--tRNA ligase [Candidatus Woesearchaeota archaeon]MBT5397277.1 histidine--tRNA ligase [Candidatus Woesearchaeota archaeon]MBT6367177.1 histidine--tRNA ligase [Candidatus Woesearchaeota archaeon]MBT7762677.1 histidine--tRNA ligase [Candidatus Woesearchaeota archaeon]